MSSPKTALPDDEGDDLLSRLACVRCGYLLRGQAIDGRCPECGLSVRETLAAQSPASWPTQWLRRLRRGLGLLAASVAVGWVVMAWFTLTDLGGFNFVLPWVRELQSLRAMRNERLLTLPLLGAFALGIWGTVTITFSEAARLVAVERPRSAWLAKAGAAAGAAAFVALIVPFVMTGRARNAVILVWYAIFIAGAVAVWNLGTFLARLARRMPDERLARRCESFRWVAVLVIVLASCDAANFFPVMSWLPITTSRTWWRTVAVIDTLILVGRVGLLVAGVLAIALLRTYAKRLNDPAASDVAHPDAEPLSSRP